jgi:hypothetical protein
MAILNRARRYGRWTVVRTQLHFDKIKTGRVEHSGPGTTWQAEESDTEQPKDGDIL